MDKQNKNFSNRVSQSEWERTQELAMKELARLAKLGFVDDDEFDYDDFDRYEAEEEMRKFVSSRLRWID